MRIVRHIPVPFELINLAGRQDYCLSRQNSVDAERFYDYYESNGRRVGKSSMKDWKAAVRTWERNEWNKGGTRNGKSEDIPSACYDGTI